MRFTRSEHLTHVCTYASIWPMKKIRVVVQFDTGTVKSLKKIQEETGASIAEIVRRFVKAGLAKRKK